MLLLKTLPLRPVVFRFEWRTFDVVARADFCAIGGIRGLRSNLAMKSG